MRAPKINTEIRQEQIAEAAIELIAAEGVNSLSIAGIAERVGIVPSAFYRHYKSKDEVLDAILDQLRIKLLGNVTAVRKESKKAPERLKRLMQRHVSLLAENHVIPQIVFSDSFYAGHLERKNKVKGIVADYLGEVTKNRCRRSEGRNHTGRDLPRDGLSHVFRDGPAYCGHSKCYRRQF